MEVDAAPHHNMARLSERITATMGLHFPPERWTDLQRGLAGAAKEFGFADAAKCGEWLCSAVLTKPQMQILASHLTIGETYFFRDHRTFGALSDTVLPELIRNRRERGRRLRIWSAACCTGEEPYSLAILLSQVIPDLADWHVTILATDINGRSLQKAAAGVYGEWSFRDAPPGFKERYFRRTPEGRYAILPEFKQRVTFAHLNLVEDVFPALATDTNAMDLIFCRNVLMYFSPPQFRKVVGNLRHALVDGGWLAVSPSEVSQYLYPGFKTENFPGAVLYRKGSAKDCGEPVTPPAPVDFFAPVLEDPAPWLPINPPPTVPTGEVVEDVPLAVPVAVAVAAQFYAEGRYAEASETLLAASPPPGTAPEYSLLARALANQGELGEALAWCDRWLAADKLDASAHYLRAVILQELGDHAATRLALQRALYLRPELVLPHFAFGNLARAQGATDEAHRHFANALHLLKDAPADELLPESDGLTAGRLTEIITSFLAMEITTP